ncbi:Non-specific serine/threonine protein kinase [Bertholletia excelsa]
MEETSALLALRDELNNPTLNNNWSGPVVCIAGNPSPWLGIQCSGDRVSGIVLESLGIAAKISSNALYSLSELTVLNFRNNSVSGEMMDFARNQKLKKIDLSVNSFDGPISDSVLFLAFLESLKLQDNRLTGSIPELNQSNLIEFNVSNNNLTGGIPITPALQKFNFSSYSGNKELCRPPSSVVSRSGQESGAPASSKNKKTHSSAVIALLLITVAGLVVLLFVAIQKNHNISRLKNKHAWPPNHRKSKRYKEELNKKKLALGLEEQSEKSMDFRSQQRSMEMRSQRSMEMRSQRSMEVQSQRGMEPRTLRSMEFRSDRSLEGEEKGKLRFVGGSGEEGFELNDLLKATAEGLGKGNFGNCYKAVLDGGPAVVVKRLRDLKPLSREEFAEQLQMMAEQKHPNLLPLIAYFCSKEERLLIYKYAANGNVYNRIHGGRGTKNRVPFRWKARVAVARGIAQALEYIHLDPRSHPILPHGNVKSSNVLLDAGDTPLVADHGLTCIIAPQIAAQRMVAFKSPEYQSHKKISRKADVWSFGCLLLELLTGRVSAHAAPQGVKGVDLGSWVHRAVREEWTAEIFDVEIAVQRTANHAMLRLLQIAVRCCDKWPVKRPDMSEVARELESIKIVVDSEDEEDLSMERSLTDDSLSATPARAVSGDSYER